MIKARQLPAMPVIGEPESFYAQQVKRADKINDPHLHEAFKVGQYITLGIDPRLKWESKVKYFEHALRRHCSPPPLPDEDVWLFYRQLADLVRTHAGAEALRLAGEKDDQFAMRQTRGEPREAIAEEAGAFFFQLMGNCHDRPPYFTEEDWRQLRLLRDQWV